MDPVWASVAELWWIGPTLIGAGTLGWLGLRGQRTARARRLAYDASRGELKTARQDAAATRLAVRIARAEMARALAERSAGRADGADVAHARRALDAAQRDAKSAAATLRVRRAHLTAARAALGTRETDPAQLPLGRLMADDDAVTARWMAYETDAARVIAFPAMTDARVPATAAFLAELRTVRALRPASADARITPAQFSAYRDGIARLAHAFDVAEAEAWRQARATGDLPRTPQAGDPDAATQPAVSTWVVSAQEIAQNLTQTVLTRGAEALARATAPRTPEDRPAEPRADREGGDEGRTPPGPSTSPPEWPIPSRSSGPSGP